MLKYQYLSAALLLALLSGQHAHCEDYANKVNASPLTLQAHHEDPARLTLEQKIENAQKKLKKANEDFEDLKKMYANNQNGDAGKQIEFSYALKKAQREIEQIGSDLTKYRKWLAEHTSDNALRNLDKSIASELTSKSDEFTIEYAQLEALFKAAIKNSPDINFVLAKFAPNADLSKTATILMKQPTMVGLALTEPHLEPDYPQIANANKIPSYQLPSSGSKYGVATRGDGSKSDQSYSQTLSFNVFQQIIGTNENSRAQKKNISQAEQIMLYNMLRLTGDKLKAHYRDYKISRKKLFKAKTDSAPQHQIEQQEKIVSQNRQLLVDIAGQEAIDKLDQELDAQFKNAANQ